MAVAELLARARDAFEAWRASPGSKELQDRVATFRQELLEIPPGDTTPKEAEEVGRFAFFVKISFNRRYGLAGTFEEWYE